MPENCTDGRHDFAHARLRRGAFPQHGVADLVEKELVDVSAPDVPTAVRLEPLQDAVHASFGVVRPPRLEITQNRLGKGGAGVPHAVDFFAVEFGLPCGTHLFREFGAVSASAFSNAFAADGARDPKDVAVGAGDDFKGHRRLSIRWLMATSSNRTRLPALMTGGAWRETSRRSVRSGTRRRVAASANVKMAGGPTAGGKPAGLWGSCKARQPEASAAADTSPEGLVGLARVAGRSDALRRSSARRRARTATAAYGIMIGLPFRRGDRDDNNATTFAPNRGRVRTPKDRS